MGFSIYQDMEEVNQDLQKWANLGRGVLLSSCKHYDKSGNKNINNVEFQDYCDKCEIYESSAIPIMNYLYPLELRDFSDEDILKVVKETNCTILKNNDTDEYFLSLCGGGMDLSQDIAYSYLILERWIPKDLLIEVSKQPLLSLGGEKYKQLARAVINQLKNSADNFKSRAKEWRESLKELKGQEAKKKKS